MLVTKYVVHYHNYFGDGESVYDTLAEAKKHAGEYNRRVDPGEYAEVSPFKEVVLTPEEELVRASRRARRFAEVSAMIKADSIKRDRIATAKAAAWARKHPNNGVSTDPADAVVDFSVLDDDFDSEDFPL